MAFTRSIESNQLSNNKKCQIKYKKSNNSNQIPFGFKKNEMLQ